MADSPVTQRDPVWVKMSNNQLLPDLYPKDSVVRCNEVFADWVVKNGNGVEVNEDGSAIGAPVAPATGTPVAPATGTGTGTGAS